MNKKNKNNSNISIILHVTFILSICAILLVLVGVVLIDAFASESIQYNNQEYINSINEYHSLANIDNIFSYDYVKEENDTYYDFGLSDRVITEEDDTENPIEYTVQYGDSFWAISEKFYGDGNNYSYIMACNNMTKLYPGDTVLIYDPEVYEIDESVVDEVTTTVSATSYIEPDPVESSDGTKPDWTTYKDSTVYDTTGMTYAGNFKITGYDPHCSHCCGKTDGITASGNQAILGYSVGSNSLPLGTKVYIEGYGIFRVDDMGGSSTNLIDIACDSHDICYHMTGRADVYIIP